MEITVWVPLNENKVHHETFHRLPSVLTAEHWEVYQVNVIELNFHKKS